MRCYWCLEETEGSTFMCPNCQKIFQSKGTCPDCRVVLCVKCQKCGNPIYETYTKNLFGIALVGDTGVGKTHFLVSTVKAFNNGIMAKRGFNLRLVERKYWNDLVNHIQKQKKVLKRTTKSSPKEVSIVGSLEHRNIGKLVNISLVDVAGEDIRNLNDGSGLDLKLKYLTNADVVLFMIDLFQIENIQNEYVEIINKKELSIPAATSDPLQPLEDLITYMENVRNSKRISLNPLRKFFFGGKENEKFEKPIIAVVINKIDLMFEVIDEVEPGFLQNSPLRRNTKHFTRGEFLCLKEINQINDDIKAILDWFGLQALINLIEGNFKNYCFFGVSALGTPPDSEGNIRTWDPLRVEEPILWTLYEANKIAGSERC